MNSTFWENIWARLKHVFEEMTKSLRKSIPNLRMHCGHSHNDNFPFRAFATFPADIPEDETRVVDVSVDCWQGEGFLLIMADIALLTGLVIDDVLPTKVPLYLTETEISSSIDNAMQHIEAFFIQQTSVIQRIICAGG